MTKTCVIVDGNNLVHRAYHGWKRTDIRSTQGVSRWALVGLAHGLASVPLQQIDACVIGFDGPSSQSWRHETNPAYKATRQDKDEDLSTGLKESETWLQELGLCVRTVAGWEADDVCATIARRAQAQGYKCVVLSSDKDLWSLISKDVSVFRPKAGGWDIIDETKMESIVGVRGDLYRDLCALRGDKSDNLDGVAGIGPKRAAEIISALSAAGKTLEDFLGGDEQAVDATGRWADCMRDSTTTIENNLAMMTLRSDLELNVKGAQRGPSLEQVISVCEQWEVPQAKAKLAVFSKKFQL